MVLGSADNSPILPVWSGRAMESIWSRFGLLEEKPEHLDLVKNLPMVGATYSALIGENTPLCLRPAGTKPTITGGVYLVGHRAQVFCVWAVSYNRPSGSLAQHPMDAAGIQLACFRVAMPLYISGVSSTS